MANLALQKTRLVGIDGVARFLHPQEYADEVVKQSGSSFYWPMKLMSTKKREAIMAIYAFCRLVDDEVDNALNLDSAAKKLNFFQQQIEVLYDQDGVLLPTHPVAKALSYHIREFDLKKEYFIAIIEGCRADLRGEMLRPRLAQLDEYCENVASAVGLLTIEVFGYKDERTKKFAKNLGKFLQIVNILRDVRDDAKKGRIYLPHESLKQYGVAGITPQQILNDSYSLGLRTVYAEMGEIARKFLHKSQVNLSAVDKDSLRPALFMRDIYLRYLNIMEEKEWVIVAEDLDISFFEKMKIFAKLMTGDENLVSLR